MKTTERAIVGLLCLLAVLAGVYLLQGPPPKILPDSTAATLDSIRETRPAFDSVITNITAGADRLVEVDRRLARKERALKALADSLRARKDSLALEASAHPDSALAWHRAYVAADSETTSLRVVIDTLRARVDTLRAEADSLRVRGDVALARLDVVEPKLLELRAAIDRLATRRWQDYVAVGCGIGIRGADCMVGLRLPLGR